MIDKPTSTTTQTGLITTSDFHPPWWANNRHVQTVWPRFLQPRQTIDIQSERLELADGDFIDLAWANKPATCKGISILFHGLEGSVRSHYANDMMLALQQAGWWPVLMHFRGCSGELNRLPRAYHSGDTQDALHVMQLLHTRFPKTTKVGLGFSLGANMLLKLLGENINQPYIKAAVAISAPFKLAECAAHIGKGFSHFYQKYLLNSLKRKVEQKMQRMDLGRLLPNRISLKDITNFWQFDQHFTAPIHGFSSAQDYYQRCSAIHFLRKINTNTLILHATDDPFMSPNVVPSADQLSSKVTCVLSEKGGHVGFMQGTPWAPKIWSQHKVTEYFEAFA